jgi:hypothetical protein
MQERGDDVVTVDEAGGDLLAGWLSGPSCTARDRGRQPPAPEGRLQFAFYGRISTKDYQDRASSRQWQYDSASENIAVFDFALTHGGRRADLRAGPR